MGEAFRRFDTPVTGGNVSFYNQNPDGPVFPTPTIGMVGLLEDAGKKMTLDLKNEGDLIIMVGSSSGDINSSQYLAHCCGIDHSPAPAFELEEEFSLQQRIQELIRKDLIESAHDVSEGGLFVALLESAFNRQLGFDVMAKDPALRKDGQWFGEKQSRVIISVKPENLASVEKVLNGSAFEELGVVTNGSIEVDGMNWGEIAEWMELYDTAIEKYLSKEEAGSALSSI